MKIFSSTILAARNLVSVTFFSAIALTACAAPNAGVLPIQTVSGPVGSISSARSYEQRGKLIVAGSARPSLSSRGHHVDIQLVGADGRVIAEEIEAIKLGHPRGSRSRHGSGSFVASFPLAVADQARRVRVAFHSESH